MDFTRQPLIESVITAKEGCKLVVRSSKGSGQEEYFVDAVEVVSFGNSFFFRSQEKPKSFLVPVTDYEILEVREARMVLKNVGIDRSIKIAGGKEVSTRQNKEMLEKASSQQLETDSDEMLNRSVDKKRDRRRTLRRRKREEESDEKLPSIEANIIPPPPLPEKPLRLKDQKKYSPEEQEEKVKLSTTVINSLLPPPPNLISIEKYKENKVFEGVFLSRDPLAESVEKMIDEPVGGLSSDKILSHQESDTYISAESQEIYAEESKNIGMTSEEGQFEKESDLSYRQQIHYNETSATVEEPFLWGNLDEDSIEESSSTPPYVESSEDFTSQSDSEASHDKDINSDEDPIQLDEEKPLDKFKEGS